MKVQSVLVSALCLCGCETVSLVHLAQVAHEVVDTQRDLHTFPKRQVEPAPSRPARAAPVTSAVAARLSAGASQARTDRPGGTDAARLPQAMGYALEGSTPSEDAIAPLLPTEPSVSPAKAQFVFEAAVATLWNEYRAFHYEAVLRDVSVISALPGFDRRQKAAALIIGGSAAYILGDGELAREMLSRAAVLAPDVRPDRRVFPNEVCAMHEIPFPSKP
jgi:hypothetical protein